MSERSIVVATPKSHHLSLGDILRYGDLIVEIITLGEKAKGLAVGAEMQVPDIKFEANGHHYTLKGETLTRTA